MYFSSFFPPKLLRVTSMHIFCWAGSSGSAGNHEIARLIRDFVLNGYSYSSPHLKMKI